MAKAHPGMKARVFRKYYNKEQRRYIRWLAGLKPGDKFFAEKKLGIQTVRSVSHYLLQIESGPGTWHDFGRTIYETEIEDTEGTTYITADWRMSVKPVSVGETEYEKFCSDFNKDEDKEDILFDPRKAHEAFFSSELIPYGNTGCNTVHIRWIYNKRNQYARELTWQKKDLKGYLRNQEYIPFNVLQERKKFEEKWANRKNNDLSNDFIEDEEILLLGPSVELNLA